ncbi:class D beta-lactamase [Marinilongibacter aquaticus]|uniref:penicillin-binding transpeptidase domain-containing protein n=1 Tax=Marinilongibacter aquaticus TaxID=2975157 RepID=UPI0021BD1F20|nr:penicillin-binding transpeptidase domain-containing protein [Marinilongibacter aquaticus]UBM57232.1 class D beta-lactamase [Marinilongibacter aquaticus]
MKIFLLLIGLFALFACTHASEEKGNQKVKLDSFQHLLDSAKVKGAVLVYDKHADRFYSNNFAWADSGFLPASTFKIANSINALENGIVENDSTMLPWDGQPRYMKSWEADMTFAEAYKKSCLPCYQEIARKTGEQNMRQLLERIEYPGMVFDSTNFDRFWVQGDSKISQFQQVDFLKRLVEKQLPIQEHSYQVLNRIMQIELDEGVPYTLWGKTGWAQTEEANIGWFVGYAQKDGRIYYLATNVQPGEGFNMDDFFAVRMGLSLQALNEILKD